MLLLPNANGPTGEGSKEEQGKHIVLVSVAIQNVINFVPVWESHEIIDNHVGQETEPRNSFLGKLASTSTSFHEGRRPGYIMLDLGNLSFACRAGWIECLELWSYAASADYVILIVEHTGSRTLFLSTQVVYNDSKNDQGTSHSRASAG